MYPATPLPTKVLTATTAPTNTPDPASTATSTPAPATPTFLPQPATATATPYTLDGFKTVYENQIYREKLLAEITKDTPHTEEQVLARHILIDDEQLAGAVYALLKDG